MNNIMVASSWLQRASSSTVLCVFLSQANSGNNENLQATLQLIKYKNYNEESLN